MRKPRYITNLEMQTAILGALNTQNEILSQVRDILSDIQGEMESQGKALETMVDDETCGDILRELRSVESNTRNSPPF